MAATEYVTVARLADFENRYALRVTLAGRHIALFRDRENIYALDDSCPHKGGPLSAGWIEEGHVFCPLHGWKFDLKTGVCETSPERPARTFAVRISGDEVQVRLNQET